MAEDEDDDYMGDLARYIPTEDLQEPVKPQAAQVLNSLPTLALFVDAEFESVIIVAYKETMVLLERSI